ncbi:hypothetical protein J5J86_13015 [Aquabacter sp. L1I39]|uniref:hypothetical protein n=1 Tax=Aquabacter sp. L1I39 TaxID=2820278 RepID=UPI001ADB44F5|nr:hypothetical protein [Aquabacter sp. L1I39]QTL01736.1 hypothetical protein J5J86_13015 [Aquabacter sp. L1I39]
MRAIRLLERFIFGTPLWVFLGGLCAIALVRTGTWYIPNITYSQILAQNPFTNPFEEAKAHYIVWSWLDSFLAWVFGATSPLAFYLLHLGFSLAFIALMITLCLRELPRDEARIALLAFFALPASTTALFWVSYDSLTLLLMALALATRRWRFAPVICGFGLGLQNFEQGALSMVVLFAALALRAHTWTPLPAGPLFALRVLSGTVVGKIALYLVFFLAGMKVNSGRFYYLQSDIALFLAAAALHAHVVVWSTLGTGWLIAVRYADLGRRALPFFLALAGAVMVSAISDDQTRVVAIVAFPLEAVHWVLDRGFLSGVTKPQAALLLLVFLLVPWTWTWGGKPMWSVFPYDVAYVLNALTGWPPIARELLPLWPFR